MCCQTNFYVTDFQAIVETLFTVKNNVLSTVSAGGANGVSKKMHYVSATSGRCSDKQCIWHLRCKQLALCAGVRRSLQANASANVCGQMNEETV